MSSTLTVQKLFDDISGRLELTWLAGRNGHDNFFSLTDTSQGMPTVVGHFNLIHSNQVQVLGATALEYYGKLDSAAREQFFEQLFKDTTRMILVADGKTLPDVFPEEADKNKVPLLQSPHSSNTLIYDLRYYFTRELAEKMTIHGTFMEVISVGVLLTGASSIGKSELALELLTRGHRLVADDAPQFARIAPEIVSGTCPEVLQDFLEVRGLGILNVREMYGDSVIKHGKYLRLIIDLKEQEENDLEEHHRLYGNVQSQDVLGIPIPRVTLHVAPGRNLAVLVEAAVRNHLLRQKNYNSGEDFIQRQQRMIDTGES